jgi:hypothetical protein
MEQVISKYMYMADNGDVETAVTRWLIMAMWKQL